MSWKSELEPSAVRRLLHERGICVVIPTYNNRGTLPAVAQGVREWCDDVIVVNDGSTDGTSALLSSLPGIHIVSYPRNRGKGYALSQGFRRAQSLGFAYAISIDADGQFFPRDIVRFLQANRRHPGALVLGARRMEGIVQSKGSAFANRFSNFWFYVQTGRQMQDTQTGFRLYPLNHLGCLSLLPSRYEGELALIVFAAWHGVPLVSVDVDVYYPPAEERVSHFRPGRDFLRISLLNCVLCLLAIVYGLPLRLLRWIDRWGRTLYAGGTFVVCTLLVLNPWVWLVSRLGTMTEQKRQHLHHLIHRLARWVVLQHGIPGVRFTHSVPEHLDLSQPRVIICNHQSHIDLICQLILTPRMVFITNEWVWRNPFYGPLIRAAEYLPMAEGVEALLPRLRSLVERGYSIAIYPEGTRSQDGSLGRFHQGAFYIARQLGLDVLPCLLYGTGRCLQKHTYTLRRGHVHLAVGEPMPTDPAIAPKDRARALRQHYQQWSDSLSNQLDRYA